MNMCHVQYSMDIWLYETWWDIKNKNQWNRKKQSINLNYYGNTLSMRINSYMLVYVIWIEYSYVWNLVRHWCHNKQCARCYIWNTTQTFAQTTSTSNMDRHLPFDITVCYGIIYIDKWHLMITNYMTVKPVIWKLVYNEHIMYHNRY